MPNYTLTFTGRRAGAIGIFYWITFETTAPNPRAALLQAYGPYEHIQQLTMVEHRPGPIVDGQPSIGVAVVVRPEEYGR